MLWTEFYKAGIVTVGDLFNENNELMDYKQFLDKYNVKCDILKFYKLRKAIPIDWVHDISMLSSNITSTSSSTLLQIRIINARSTLTTLKAKHAYNTFVLDKWEKPTAFCKWESCYGVEDDWIHILTLPYSCTRDTRLQAFQYRIINRILPCRKWLNILTVVDSDLCTMCGDVDDIEHFLYLCPTTRVFWEHLEKWWNRLSPCNVTLTLKHILFGIYYDLKYFAEINFIIILAKYYIYIKKHYKEQICFFTFLSHLKYKLMIEEYAHKINNTTEIFQKKWKNIFDEL